MNTIGSEKGISSIKGISCCVRDPGSVLHFARSCHALAKMKETTLNLLLHMFYISEKCDSVLQDALSTELYNHNQVQGFLQVTFQNVNGSSFNTYPTVLCHCGGYITYTQENHNYRR
jgi:hypothetical protein